MLFLIQIYFTGIGRNSLFMYYSSILCKLFEVSCCCANCVCVYINTCIYLVHKLKIWPVYVLVKFPCLSSLPVWFPHSRLIPELCCSGTPPRLRVCPRPPLPATSSTWSAPRRAGESCARPLHGCSELALGCRRGRLLVPAEVFLPGASACSPALLPQACMDPAA